MTDPVSELRKSFEDVATVLREGATFLITGHRNPDGDSLGSGLALALALENAGKTAHVVVRDPWSHAYDVLPGLDRVKVSDTLPDGFATTYDAIFTMECPDPSRPGYPDLLTGRVVNVDHHPGNTGYGAVNLVDLSAAAVGEMIADLLDRLDWPITEPIATNLWVSLVSDTGSFRYSNTSAKALALGARLVAAGVKPGPIGESLFESSPLSSLRLEALVLQTLELHAGGTVATIDLRSRFFSESGAGSTESEGLVNRARGIAGVEAAAMLREAEPGTTRCSLRSKGTVDVRSVASRFGGGGHRNAAGCSVPGSLDEAKATLVPLLAEAVRNSGKA